MNNNLKNWPQLILNLDRYDQTAPSDSESAAMTSLEPDAVLGPERFFMTVAVRSLVRLKRAIEVSKMGKVLIHLWMMVFAISWHMAVCIFLISLYIIHLSLSLGQIQ
jgi:hypothetical protein